MTDLENVFEWRHFLNRCRNGQPRCTLKHGHFGNCHLDAPCSAPRRPCPCSWCQARDKDERASKVAQ